MSGQRSAAVVVLGLALVHGGAARAQVAQVPTSLALTLPAREADQGARLTATVVVRNFKDQRVVVREPLEVTIESDLLAGPVRQRIPAGTDSATVTLAFDRPGIVKLRAAAPRLAAGYAVIAIKRRGGPAASASPAGWLARQLVAVLAAQPAAGPPIAPAAAGATRLWLEVLPPRVIARGRTWSAQVLVAAVNDRNEPAEVAIDTPVRLAAVLGTVVPGALTIARGTSTAAEEVRLTSSQPGTDTLFASSPMLGGRAEHQIEYEQSRPVKVVVTSTPAEVVTSGRSSVAISVLLKDQDDRVVSNPSADLAVVLSSTRGTLSRAGQPAHVVTIVKGSPNSDDIMLSSGRAGTAVVTADAAGLDSGSVQVLFILPWLLIGLAALGGVGGAVLRSPSGLRRAHLPRNLAFGALLGIVFFGLVLSGVPGLLPAIPVQPIENLTLNEVGAFLLGVCGGYVGRRFLDTLLLPVPRARKSVGGQQPAGPA